MATAIRKFRVDNLEELKNLTFELMIRKINYYVRPITVKGETKIEVVTSTQLTEVAKTEIVNEAKKNN